MNMMRTPAVLREARMAERVQRGVVRLGRPWGEGGGSVEAERRVEGRRWVSCMLECMVEYHSRLSSDGGVSWRYNAMSVAMGCVQTTRDDGVVVVFGVVLLVWYADSASSAVKLPAPLSLFLSTDSCSDNEVHVKGNLCGPWYCMSTSFLSFPRTDVGISHAATLSSLLTRRKQQMVHKLASFGLHRVSVGKAC